MSVEVALREFHEAFPNNCSTEEDLLDLRENLIKEEFTEVLEALDLLNVALMHKRVWKNSKNDGYTQRREELLKELCDLVYVCVGTAVQLGCSFDEAFDRVHKSNMTKVWPDGTVHYREDGKVLKPDTYKKASMKGLV